MKFILSVVMICVATTTSFAQGTLIFSNRPPTGDVPVMRPSGAGAGAGITAQLYLVGAGGALTPLTPTTTFQTSSPDAAYFVNEINPFVVNGILPGQSATFRFVYWETAAGSYEAAVGSFTFLFGQSNDVLVNQLGGTPAGGTPIPPPALNGLRLVSVPEPSGVAIGILGAVALLGLRRWLIHPARLPQRKVKGSTACPLHAFASR